MTQLAAFVRRPSLIAADQEPAHPRADGLTREEVDAGRLRSDFSLARFEGYLPQAIRQDPTTGQEVLPEPPPINSSWWDLQNS